MRDLMFLSRSNRRSVTCALITGTHMGAMQLYEDRPHQCMHAQHHCMQHSHAKKWRHWCQSRDRQHLADYSIQGGMGRALQP